MKNVIVMIVAVCASVMVQAQEVKVKKSKNKEYVILVNGNCEMCKKRIEKAAFSVKGVRFAEWHQEDKDVHVFIDETKTTIDAVHEAIAKAGHDTDKVRADDEVYEKLHTCCMYERRE